jgi:hypothetical protein
MFLDVFVVVDNQAPQILYSFIEDYPADEYHESLSYKGLIDGVQHTYRFYSIGTDYLDHNTEAAPDPPADVTFTETFTSPATLRVDSFSVDHGAAGRSYIRYLDLGFNASDSQSGGLLSQIAGSVGSTSPQVMLYKYDLNGTAASKTRVSLQSPAMLNVIDHAIEIDFGAGGIGGVPGSTAADGYYELDLVLPNGQTVVHHFDRLLGDVTGDGIVDNSDLAAVAAAITQSTAPGVMPLAADVNGDGTVNSLDSALVVRAKGHRLASGLVLG